MAEIKAKISLDNQKFISAINEAVKSTDAVVKALNKIDFTPDIDLSVINKDIVNLTETLNNLSIGIDTSAINDLDLSGQIASIEIPDIEIPVSAEAPDVEVPEIPDIEIAVNIPEVDTSPLEQQFKGAGERAKSNFESSLSKIRDIAVGGIIGNIGGKILSNLIPDISASRELARIQEQAEKGVEAILKSTGKVADISVDNVKRIASEFQQLTTFGDEATLQAQKLLLSFGKVAKTEGELKSLTKTTLDLAAGMGGDPVAAAQLLGRAMEDPINASRTLRQANIFLAESEKEQLKALVESGKEYEAQQLIISRIANTYDGFASQIASTDSGQITQLTNRLGDLQEQIGFLANKLIVSLMPVFDEVIKIVEDFIPTIADVMNQLQPALQSLAGAVIPIVKILGDILPTIAKLLTAVLEPLGKGIAQIINSIQPLIGVVMNLVNSLVVQLSPVVEKLINLLVSALVPIFGALTKIIEPVIEVIGVLAGVAIEIIDTALEPLGEIMKVVALVVAEVADVFVLLAEPIVELVKLFTAMVKPLLAPLSELIVKIVSILPQMIKGFFALAQMATKLFMALRQGLIDTLLRLIGVLFGTKDAGETLAKVMGFLTGAIEIVTQVVEVAVKIYTKYVETVIGLTNAVLEFFGLVEKKEKKAPFAKTVDNVNDLNAELSSDAPSNYTDGINQVNSATRELSSTAVDATGKLINLSSVINSIASQRIDIAFNVRENEVDKISKKLNEIKISDLEINIDNFKGLKSVDEVLAKAKETKVFFETETGGVWLDEQTVKLKEILKDVEILKKELESISDEQIIEFNIDSVVKAQNDFINQISELRDTSGSAILKNLEKQKQDINDFLATSVDLSEAEIAENLKKIQDLNNQIVAETIRSGKINNAEKEKLAKSYQSFLKLTNDVILQSEKDNNQKLLNEIEQQELTVKNLITKRGDELAKVREQQNEMLEQIRIDNIRDSLERERVVRLKELDERYKSELKLAEGNLELINALTLKYRLKQNEIIEQTTPKSNFDSILNSFQNLSKALSTPQKVDFSNFDRQRKEIKNNQIELEQSLKRGEISYSSYIDKLIELDKKQSEVSKAENEAKFAFLKQIQVETINLFAGLMDNSLQEINTKFTTAIDDYLVKLEQVKLGLIDAKDATLDWGAVFTDLAGTMGTFFLSGLAKAVIEGGNLLKSLALMAIDTATAMLNAYAAAVLFKKNLELPFGLGTIAFAALYASANVLLALARSAVAGAESGVVGITKNYNKKKGRTDTIPLMVAEGESVINKKATQKNKSLLEYLNSGGELSDYIKSMPLMDLGKFTNSIVFIPEIPQINYKNDARIDRLEAKIDKLMSQKVEVQQTIGIESKVKGVRVSGGDLEFLVENAKRAKIKGF